MCGRGTQKLSWRELHDLMQLTVPAAPSNLEPNYNVAPTQQIFVCTRTGNERRLERMRWGLVPFWAKEIPKYATFNARVETIEEKPTWKGSLNKMRAIVPFSGFYEWKGSKGEKQPYYITRRDEAPLLLAGLWAINDKIEGEIRSATIIVCEPNEAMAQIHNRMPVVLDREEAGEWLEGPWSADKRGLLKPCADGVLTASPVGKAVGSVKNNSSGLIEPTGAPLF